MAFEDNERLQEIALLAGDKFSVVSKKWWYALAITVVAAFPAYFAIKYGFVSLLTANYEAPEIIYSEAVKEKLSIIDKKIWELPNHTYSGYVRVKNINLEWGVAAQNYTAEFKTFGGTVLTQVAGSVFILPSSEKLIVFSRFSADQKPDELNFSLGDTQFVRKPDINFTYSLERQNIQNDPAGLVVSAAIKNTTPFTIRQIYLPVLIYDNKNQIVAANSTLINNVRSGETRSFTYTWPGIISGAARSEINPEINIFDKNVFEVIEGTPSFDDLPDRTNNN